MRLSLKLGRARVRERERLEEEGGTKRKVCEAQPAPLIAPSHPTFSILLSFLVSFSYLARVYDGQDIGVKNADFLLHFFAFLLFSSPTKARHKRGFVSLFSFFGFP